MNDCHEPVTILFGIRGTMTGTCCGIFKVKPTVERQKYSDLYAWLPCVYVYIYSIQCSQGIKRCGSTLS